MRSITKLCKGLSRPVLYGAGAVLLYSPLAWSQDRLLEWTRLSNVAQQEVVYGSRVLEPSGIRNFQKSPVLEPNTSWTGPLEGVVTGSRAYRGYWDTRGWPTLSMREVACEAGTRLKYEVDVVYGSPIRPAIVGKLGLVPLGVSSGFSRYSGNLSGHSLWLGPVKGEGVVRTTVTDLVMNSPKQLGGESVQYDKYRPSPLIYHVESELEAEAPFRFEANDVRGWQPQADLTTTQCAKFGWLERLDALDALLWLGNWWNLDRTLPWGDPLTWRGEEANARVKEILTSKNLQDAQAGLPEVPVTGVTEKPLIAKKLYNTRGSMYGNEIRSRAELNAIEREWRRLGALWGSNREWILRDSRGTSEVEYLEWGQELATSGLRVTVKLGILPFENKGFWSVSWESAAP